MLAILAVLSALILPKIFEAIHNARVSHTAIGLNTIKTAAAQHVAKFGQLSIDGTVSPPSPIPLDVSDTRALQFDAILLKEQFIDTPFTTRIGDGVLGPEDTRIELARSVSSSADPEEEEPAFDLDGTGFANDAIGSVVLFAVISGVSVEDARALNRILDGTSASWGENPAGNDFVGRVKYRKPTGVTGASQASESARVRGTSRAGNSERNGNGKGQGDTNGNADNDSSQGQGGGNGDGKDKENDTKKDKEKDNRPRSNTVKVLIYLTHY